MQKVESRKLEVGSSAGSRAIQWFCCCCIFTATLAAAEPLYDWSAIPASGLDAQLDVAAKQVAPLVAGKRILVAPFIGNRHHLNPWAFETIAQEHCIAAMRRAGIHVVDDAPVRARYRPEIPGLPPTIPYSTRGLVELAASCKADIVVLGGVQILNETTITIYVHDGADGHRLMKSECELTAEDVAIPALTPLANRQVVSWAESHLAARFTDGTASGFAQAVVTDHAAQPQPRGTVPLPGDVVLWWERWHRIRRPRCGVIVAINGIGRADVMVQRRTGPGAPIVEVQAVDFHGFPWVVARPGK